MKSITQKLLAVLLAVVLGVSLAVAQTKTVTHTVGRGETLKSIANRYGTTIDKIIELNPDAVQFIYVGMELSIPAMAVPADGEANTSINDDLKPQIVPTNRQSTNIYSAGRADEDTFESERKRDAYEVGYGASSFEDVKLSGSYGLSMTFLPWKIAPRLYAGFHFSPLNLNYGLVPSSAASDLIKLGPAIGYYFTPKVFIAMPLNVLCGIYFNEDDKVTTTWGMSLAPCVYFGSNAGVFVGPQLTFAFSGGSDVACGFRAGFYF